MPAYGGLTCYGAPYARQQTESISCICMESPNELAARKKCHLFKLDLLILVMPLSFVFLPRYIPLVNISNAACSSAYLHLIGACDICLAHDQLLDQ